MSPKKKKLVTDGYIRVSRRNGREGDSFISPEQQRDEIMAYAQARGITIAKIHEPDIDKSGKTMHRPSFDAAMARCRNGETGGIIVAKVNRFARSLVGALKALQELEDCGAEFVSVAEGFDTTTPAGKLALRIMLVFAEFELDRITDAWEDAQERAINDGVWIGAAPFGYRKPHKRAKLELDPETAPHVRKAYELTAQQGINAACRYLTEHCPNGSRWDTTRVRRMLASKVYLGTVWNGEAEHQHAHEAIVDFTLWTAAQTEAQGRAPSEAFPLSGVIKCATCGELMTGGRGPKGQRIYRCSRLQTLEGGSKRGHSTITAQLAEAHVERITSALFAQGKIQVGQPPELDGPRQELADAQQELDSYVTNQRLRKALGAADQAQMDALLTAVEQAEEAYVEAAREVERSNITIPEAFDYSDVDMARALLEHCYAGIYVGPGRGVSRIHYVPYEADGSVPDEAEVRELLAHTIAEMAAETPEQRKQDRAVADAGMAELRGMKGHSN